MTVDLASLNNRGFCKIWRICEEEVIFLEVAKQFIILVAAVWKYSYRFAVLTRLEGFEVKVTSF